MKKFLFYLFISLIVLACNKKEMGMNNGIYANIFTNKGKITAELYYKEAPLTAMSFIGLAEGTIKNDAKSGPYFSDILFHRVVEGFVIQTGDPTGTGMGGPGYNFPDEINKTLSHNTEGILSMANSGPNTNGSQFFITLSSNLAYLDSKHAIFGKVVKGMDIVKKIVQGDKIDKVEIVRVGDDAKKFLANDNEFAKLSESYSALKKEEGAKYVESQIETIASKYNDFEKDTNGILFKITKQGTGDMPKDGKTVSVDYEGFLLDGSKFDSSLERKEPIELKLGSGQVISGWELALKEMKVGEERTIIIPPNLAYGDAEIPGAIKGNSYLMFKMTLREVK